MELLAHVPACLPAVVLRSLTGTDKEGRGLRACGSTTDNMCGLGKEG